MNLQEQFGEMLPPTYIAEEIADLQPKYLERVKDNGAFLDVHAGDGANALFMGYDRFKSVTANMASPEAALAAQERAKNLGISAVKFTHVELADLGTFFKPESFNVMLASRVLHKLAPKERGKLITTMQGLLIPGGMTAVSAYVKTPELVNSSRSQDRDMAENFLGHNTLEDIYMKHFGWRVKRLQSKRVPTQRDDGSVVQLLEQSIIAYKPFPRIKSKAKEPTPVVELEPLDDELEQDFPG